MSRYSNLIRNYTTCQYNFGYVAAYLHIPGAQKKRGGRGVAKGSPPQAAAQPEFQEYLKMISVFCELITQDVSTY